MLEKDLFINIIVDRESVTASDDLEEHKKTIEIKTSANPVVFIKRVVEKYKMPTILGKKHSWNCFLNENLIVVIKGNNFEFNPVVKSLSFQKINKVFFSYIP